MFRIAILGAALMLLMGCQTISNSHSNVTAPVVFEGAISSETLLRDYPEFAKHYAQYKPSNTEISAAQSLRDKSILVLFGTWCHDSEREVPRLLKVLHEADVQPESLRLVAVNYDKIDPNGIALAYSLRYTPTFILLEEQKELGRVVERPVVSLTEDLQQLAQ